MFFSTMKNYPKKSLITFLVSLCLSSLNAQNVGIRTNNPQSPLHIFSGGDASLTAASGYLILGNPALTNIVFDDNEILARNAGSPSDLFLNIEGGNIVLGKAGNSLVGIGLHEQFIQERLHIGTGNIRLNNSNKGIILNASDRPFITRGWDAFTSGNYAGLGRWGLFMEPTKLTFGIPNIGDRAFDFATYETNSTRNTVLSINRIGRVTRPATKFVDLLPFCMGLINPNGFVLAGSGNFDVLLDNCGTEWCYEITVDDFVFTETNYLAHVTCRYLGPNGSDYRDQAFGVTSVRNGKLVVHLFHENKSTATRTFQFSVYRL